MLLGSAGARGRLLVFSQHSVFPLRTGNAVKQTLRSYQCGFKVNKLKALWIMMSYIIIIQQQLIR